MREGPAKYYVVVAPRKHWWTPGVWEYRECGPNDKQLYLETVTMQDYVKQSFDRCGHLWSREEILLKMVEEIGELVRAFRKEGDGEQKHEYGDLLFSMMALAVREGLNSNDLLCDAVLRFEKYCNKLMGHQTEPVKAQQIIQTNAAMPLHGSYTQRCSACSSPIHKTNQSGLCANCYSTRRALAGNMTEAVAHAQG